MRIAGLSMLHDDDRYGKMALDSLAEFCTEGICVNLNDATPILKEVAKTHPSVRGIIETTNGGKKWNQGKVRTDTLRMLDSIKPDIVLFSDSDETFTTGFKTELDRFIASDRPTMFFRLMYLWDSPKRFRRDRAWRPAAHCRAFRWKEGLTFTPYGGYACPTDYRWLPRSSRFYSDEPMVHWGYAFKDDRDRKLSRGFCAPKSDTEMELMDVPEGMIDDKYASQFA